MLTTLLILACTTAAQNDCELYAPGRWPGSIGPAECARVRDTMLFGRDGKPPLQGDPRVRIWCETER